MSEKAFILSFDHGTTGIKACLFEQSGVLKNYHLEKFSQYYPYEGWVEHDPQELWELALSTAKKLLKKEKINWSDIALIATTNQRETTILWDKNTGKAVYPAIVWQCRRTAEYCQTLKNAGKESWVQERSGLILDPYFSASKIRWILDHVPECQNLLEKGSLLFGTVDTWILWNLSGGALHITDPSNASRSSLYNIHTQNWDQDLLDLFQVPKEILPELRPSSSILGESFPAHTGGFAIPLAGLAGDQQAALYGQRCWEPGKAKSTYGTGTFVMMNLGQKSVCSKKGLLTTLACNSSGDPAFALEGSVFIAGAAVDWLEEIGIVERPEDLDTMAMALKSNEGVYFVPALVGLGAPHWNSKARGMIWGLSQGVGKAHIARAVLEAMAYQTREVLGLMEKESSIQVEELRVDGGVTRSQFLLQFLADILATPVRKANDVHLTAKGAAYLGGLATGFWASPEEILTLPDESSIIEPNMPQEKRESLYQEWLEIEKKVLV
ncbi:MAG: glycerol kinase [Waddliaceae bacterium]|nr:glycerol kinase [Waddliaceae bacterium]